jgi:hypothetical protein
LFFPEYVELADDLPLRAEPTEPLGYRVTTYDLVISDESMRA